MKELFLLVLSIPYCTLIIGQSNTVRRQQVDVLHYRFGLEVNDDDNVLKGEATIHIRFLTACTSLTIDLRGKDSSGKGMIVSTVKSGNKMLKFRQFADKILTDINARAGETKTVTFRYSGVPSDGLIISKNKHGHRTMFADNWPDRAHNWIPCADDPADKSSVEFIVQAPKHYQVISNGIKISETILLNNIKQTHWRESIALPTKVMVVGLADFKIGYAGNAGGIPVYSWVYPEDSINGLYDFALARDILPWFIQNVGPYPYRKLANVQSTTRFGGMENASAIFYSENSIKGNRKMEALITHEIAHQWFGNSVTEKSWNDVWLSEGFATYCTLLYLESKYGTDTLVRKMKTDRDSVTAFAKKRNTPVVDTGARSNFMQLLNFNSYEKGAWVLHMLRHQLGNRVFWEGIRRYYDTYKGKNASSADFIKTMETVSRQDLTQFFRQWLYLPGQPDLDVTWHYNETKRAVILSITQQQPSAYTITLQVLVKTGDQQFAKDVHIDKRTTVTELAFSAAPEQITLDPDVHLLFTANVREVQKPGP